MHIDDRCAQFEIITEKLAYNINRIVEKYNYDESKLISILLDVQKIVPKQYIPTEIAIYIGEKMNLPLSRVYDVISFYMALSPNKRGDYIIQVCDSVVCQVVGNAFLLNILQDYLNINFDESTEDGIFYLEKAPCFGACDVAPAIRLNGTVYGNLDTKKKIIDLLEKYREEKLYAENV